jgi:hypothetical protein
MNANPGEDPMTQPASGVPKCGAVGFRSGFTDETVACTLPANVPHTWHVHVPTGDTWDWDERDADGWEG